MKHMSWIEWRPGVSRRTMLVGATSLLLSITACTTANLSPKDRRRYFEIYRDSSNKWRWRFKGGNGKIIADSSEGYESRRECEAAIEKVKHSANAEVREVDG